MTVNDLLTEDIWFEGDVFVASANDAVSYWTGQLHPGLKEELRAEDGSLPDWFARMEVVAIGAAAGGGLLMAVK